MAKLPFDPIDLLIVDEMGKDISGSGMDTNVIGRHTTFFERPFTNPKITFIAVCGLTPNSYGNATGIGNADFTTRQLADAVNWEPTYINNLTACSPGGGKLPPVLDTAQEAIGVALACLGLDRIEDARVMRIKNTLHLTEVDVSEAFLSEVSKRDDLMPAGEAEPLAFAADGSGSELSFSCGVTEFGKSFLRRACSNSSPWRIEVCASSVKTMPSSRLPDNSVHAGIKVVTVAPIEAKNGHVLETSRSVRVRWNDHGVCSGNADIHGETFFMTTRRFCRMKVFRRKPYHLRPPAAPERQPPDDD